MPRPLRIEISESEDTLKRLLRQQSSGRRKERLQALYWLKSGQVTTRMELATLTGRGESTVYRWLKLYKSGGLSSMLEIPTSPGKPPMISGLDVPYKTVHQTVHYRLKAKLKVPRPRSRQTDEAQQQAYKKTAPCD